MCSLVAFAGGMLAGGLVMMMFAPKRGDEMRRELKERMGNLKRHLDDAVEGCKEKCHCEVDEKVVVTE